MSLPIRQGLQKLALAKAWAGLPNRQHWHAAWLQRRVRLMLGWPGLLGLILLGLALLFYVGAMLPTQTALTQTRHSIVTLQTSQKSRLATESVTPETRLTQLYQSLPTEQDIPSTLAKLFTLAEKYEIILDQGEYQAVRSKKGRLTRVQVTLPVLAAYPQVRKYLTALQSELPGLALAQVDLRREKVSDAEVEANLKLALYFVGESH